MSENVFIVWGKNYDLALKVCDELKSSGYFPVVGGAKKNVAATSFYINSNVIRQMEDASLAIILVQRIYDRSGQPTQEFRPNLMFEWGYLLRRLRADAIHPFLINLSRSDLPSDLLNAYTREVKIQNPIKPSPADIEITAKSIVSAFLADVANIDLDGLEVIQNYDAYRTFIREIAKKSRAFNSREVGYALLHMIQPAFYRDDLGFISDCLKDLSRFASGHFTSIVILINEIIKYYEVTGAIARQHQSLTVLNRGSPEYRSFSDIIDRLSALRPKREKIYNIFDVLLENFIGLSNLRAFEITHDTKQLAEAELAFKRAMMECVQFKSIHPANEGFVKTFWEAYIKRNLSRVCFYMNDPVRAQHLRDEAESARLSVSSQLSAAGIPHLARQFDLEIGLSRFDQVLMRGSSEGELTDIFERYIAPNSPRGVDRIWERLHSALLKETSKMGYAALQARLEAIKHDP
ncbi:MAG: TIR domain-containing protein [Rhodomicrobiaceae bacterium]